MAVCYNRDRCNRIARGVCQGIGDLKYLAQKTRMDELSMVWQQKQLSGRDLGCVAPRGAVYTKVFTCPEQELCGKRRIQGFFSHPDFTSPSDIWRFDINQQILRIRTIGCAGHAKTIPRKYKGGDAV